MNSSASPPDELITNRVQIMLEIEEYKGKFQITLEAKDHEIEVQPGEDEEKNEMKLVPSIKDHQRRDELISEEFPKQSLIITEIDEAQEQTEGPRIEEFEKQTYEITEFEEPENLPREMPKHEIQQKQYEEAGEVDDDKREESEKSEDLNDISSLSLIEPLEDYEHQVLSGIELTGTRRHSIEVVQSEFETRRMLTRNLSSLSRDFETSYSSNSIILNSFNVVSDIVGQDTIRALHDAFFNRSSDTAFDLIGEILTLNDALNNRYNETPIDEFIFQPGRTSTDLATQELPPLPYEEDADMSFISAIIRQFQNLQEDHGEGLYNLFITSVEQDGPPISFDAADLTDIADESDFTHLIINSSRILNLRGFNLGSILGIPELLRDPLNDDEEETMETDDDGEEETLRAEEEEDKEDEAEEEKEYKLSVEEGRLLRFVKEDICTNIKFPIVINLTNSTADAPSTSNEDQENLEDLNVEEVNVVLRRAEPSKTNLFSLMDDKAEEENELEETVMGEEGEEAIGIERLRHFRRIQEAMFATGLSSRQVFSVSDYEVNEGVLKEERMAASPEDSSSSGNVISNLWGNIKRYMLVHSKPIGACVDDDSPGDRLKKIYETSDETDEEIEIDVVGSMNNEGTGRNDEMVEKIVAIEDIEDVEVARSIRTIAEKEEEETTTTAEETLEYEEETLEGITKIKEDEVLDFKEKDQVVHSREAMSLYTLFTFWLLVFYFYLRYFSKKVASFKQSSTSTSTLKPFEIHTVPISTSTLRENATLLEEIEEEQEKDQDESKDKIIPSKFDIRNLSITESQDREEVRFEDLLLNSMSSLESFLSLDNGPDGNDVKLNSTEIEMTKFLVTCGEEFKLRLEEQELNTLRFIPDDDSSSSRSLSMFNDEKALHPDFNDKIETDEEEKRNEEKKRNEKGIERRSNLSSSGIKDEEKRGETSDETSSPEVIAISKQILEESRESAGENESFLNSKQSSEFHMKITDSFDSVYDEISEGSENYFPAVDLNESSMEEFTNVSNVSNESNRSNGSNESGVSNKSNDSNESETRKQKS